MERICVAGVSEFKACPSNCREFLRETNWDDSSRLGCLAFEKLEKFLEGDSSFSVGATAFQQAPADVLENFSAQSEVSFDLVRYFISISSPDQVKSTILEMDDSLLYRIVKEDFKIFQKLKKEKKVFGTETNFLDSKAAQFWNELPSDRISKFILYCIRNKKDNLFAARFLSLMSTEALISLRESAGLTREEEIELYRGLEESLYEFPVQTPGIYSHLLDLFAEDPEINMILSTMGGLVERKVFLLKAIDEALQIIHESDKKNTHQEILNFLNTLDKDAALEILAMLEEKSHLGNSEKTLLASYIKGEEADFITFAKKPTYRMK
ncbi:hypothetical protein EHQ53_05695 [Leptospira langatensis]|uniref:Uncharacterized protein n=1 Tax=Leptospira langatensis TaxID=2484983 RepID=A0A5F1ZTD8_9LEPT|nr:hypothetical protein [Leptospira langatensis]TGK02958.1 hypothetical protein EHO57_06530 [Leptospira langatensis]TGL41713.1 hypothetical protein EHQ53_05695 [Leptospira langatensis]